MCMNYTCARTHAQARTRAHTHTHTYTTGVLAGKYSALDFRFFVGRKEFVAGTSSSIMPLLSRGAYKSMVCVCACMRVRAHLETLSRWRARACGRASLPLSLSLSLPLSLLISLSSAVNVQGTDELNACVLFLLLLRLLTIRHVQDPWR
jgi:hypothetical protein